MTSTRTIAITQPFGSIDIGTTFEDASVVEDILTTEFATYSIAPAVMAGARVVLDGRGRHFAVMVKWNDESVATVVHCHHRTRVEAIAAVFAEAMFE